VNHRIVVVAVVAVVACDAAACSRPGTDRAFQWTEQLPVGAVVHLRNGAGQVTVRRAAGPMTLVTGTRRWRRGREGDIRFVVTHKGNDYYVCAMWRGSGKCDESGYRGRHINGFLTMFSLFHHGSDASADLTAELPANIAVDVTTTNGSVQIDGITAGVTARTTNGTVQASNVSGPLSLASTNGNVRLSTDSLSDADSVRLTTTNGTIRAELPAGVQGNFDLSAVNGVVRSDFPLPSTDRRPGRHLKGQLGTSTRVVKMKAVNGTVSLVSRGAPAAQ
jgi:hypothetical protein